MPACPTCADSFDTKRGVRHHRSLVHGESVRNYVTVECEYCGTEKDMFPSEAETFRYCSRKCFGEASKHDWLELICENCGGTYEKRPNDPNRNRFCSLECHREWQKLDNHPRYIPSDDLLAEMNRLENELGHPPSRNEMVKFGEYSAKPYYNHFGSWTAALEAAELYPDAEQRHEPLPEGHYGGGWQERRREIVRRDNHKCQDCGMSERQHKSRYNRALTVHHRINAGLWENRADAHIGLNLTTLCLVCHGKRHTDRSY